MSQTKENILSRRKIIVGDKALWLVFFILTAVSLIAVYSSIGRSAIEESGTTPVRAFIKHLVSVALTYGAIILISHRNYRIFSRISKWAFWVSIGLLVYLWATHGQRWISVPFFGQFQPSEIAKVALIVYIARLLTMKNETVDTLETFIRLLVPIAAISFLVLKENFSTAALIFVSSYIMLLLGGVNNKYWWRIFTVLLVSMVLGLAYLSISDSVPSFGRSETWGSRVDHWLHNDHEQLTQENMARMAIARGGIVGVGIGKTVFARLMTQAENDFIYAIIIEETGMVGGIAILLLYSIFYVRCIKVAQKCRGRFGALMVIGMGTVIYLQALVNMSVSVGVLPVTGQTLPFISSGGTAYLFLGIGVGIIQSVAADNQKQEDTINQDNKTTKQVEQTTT